MHQYASPRATREGFLRYAGCAAATVVTGCSNASTTLVPGVSSRDASFAFASRTSSTSATVTLGHLAPPGRLRSEFVGFSYEKLKLAYDFFSADNANLVGCFARLGKSVLRIGGDSVDSVPWIANGAGGVSGQVAPPDVDRLAGFLRATGWRIIYGINLGSNTPSNAASEAAYAARALGGSLLGFEIGNECDHYSKNGIRPSTYTFDDFLTEWSGYASAIRRSVPNAPLTGPATSDNTTWTTDFASREGASVTTLTQHHYRDDGKSSTSTMAELLAGDPFLTPVLQQVQSAAAAANLSDGFRIAEANSFYNGGLKDVSDAYGSALWAVDFLMLCAQGGASGANLHGGGNGSYDPYYTPIHDVTAGIDAIMPVYYGMLLVSRIPPGPMYAVSVNASVNMTAYAVAGNDGATYVVLVNKDGANVVNTTVAFGSAATSATALYLTGTNIASLSGTKLGGSFVGLDGTWSASSQRTFAANNARLAIAVPPATAILVKLG